VRVLVLGGTVFVGRHVVEEALARGDEVTLFNRGRTASELFPAVERLRGDRDGGLAALRGREWDVVVDTSGFVPRVVRQSAELLAGAAGRYCFVSSVSVYADFSKPPDESSPVHELADPANEEVMHDYGALKAACEHVVGAIYGDRALVVRPGLVAGPHDPTGRFTYWVVRIARGGDVLAPGPSDRHVQFIDVRDLAAWLLQAAERGVSGSFNAVGRPVRFSELLDACARASGGSGPNVEWVDPEFLVDAGVEPWTELPLWIPGEEFGGMENVDASRARGAGLVTRPALDTVRDTLAWANTVDGEPARQTDGRYRVATLTPEREADLLAAWHAR